MSISKRPGLRPGRQPKRARRTRTELRVAPSETAPGINLAESPLAWLRRHKTKDGVAMITAEQFAAGERLRADFTFAQMAPRVTANWSGMALRDRSGRGGSGGPQQLTDQVIAAQERVRRALKGVGPELSGILIDVCCHLRGLEDVERTAGWAVRSGKVVLQMALTALARHYGLLGQTAAGAPIRHWGDRSFRPSIDPGDEGSN